MGNEFGTSKWDATFALWEFNEQLVKFRFEPTCDDGFRDEWK